MKFLSWLFGTGISSDPTMLDHVPVTTSGDWRDVKLAEAAKRYGNRAFKAAPVSLPREVMNGDREFVKAKAGETVPHRAISPARLTKLRAAK